MSAASIRDPEVPLSCTLTLFPGPKSKSLYCSSCLPHSFCPLGISSHYFHCLECLLCCLHKNHILSSQPSQVSPEQMIKKKKKQKKQETCSQIICLDFSSGPWVRCLSYTPHGVKEIHRIDLFFLFLLLLFFFFLHFYLL